VDAVGPRSAYLLAGIATATAGLLVLLTMIAIPIKGRGQVDRGLRRRAEKHE